MDREIVDEARELLRASREWLEELTEEGVNRFARQELPAAAAPVAAEAAAASCAAEPEQVPIAAAQPAPVAAGARPTLDEVQARLGDCTRCRLHEGRTTIVFGDGNADADLMFIGEGPGENEDQRGLPFVGRAGELLTKMIEAGIQTPRQEVYIANIVKCRPPGNRDPQADEVAACREFLDAQIDAIRPKVIVTLGKPAASLLLGRPVAITKVRGTWAEYRGVPVMPTYHPAFVLRQYTDENRRLVWEDLKAAKARSLEG